MRRNLPILFLLLAFILGSASAFPQSLAVYSGNGQVVLEQFLTTSPLTAIARDSQGNPVSGLPITWATTTGAGTIVNASAATDSNGLTTANFLGTGVPLGLSYTQATVTASSSIGSASFYVTTVILRLPSGGTGTLPLMQLVSPASHTLTGTAGSVLPGAVSVQLSIQTGPQQGALLPNIGVRIYNYADPASTPSGACRGGTVLTDSSGIATCDLVLNNIVGESQLSAIAGEAEITPSFFLTITPGTPCTYALTPQSQSFAGAGGTGTFSLATGSNCNWTAASNMNWVVLTGPVAGSGNANIGFAVATNAGAARSANISVGSQIFTVSQAAAGVASPLTILTSSPLPGASVNTAYSDQFQATGGSQPYKWTGTSIPAGMSFSTAGLLSGTPTAAGNYTLNASVTDAAGTVVSQSFNLIVSSAPSTTGPQITTASLPGGTTGQAYHQSVAVTTSCTTPFSLPPTMTVSSGTLPPGLSLTAPSAVNFLISGTPTSAGAFAFTLTVREVCGRTANASFDIVITGPGGGTTTGGAIQVNPQAVSFTVGAGTSQAPPPALISLMSTSSSQVPYSASIVNGSGGSWLSIAGGVSGITPASISLSISNFQNLKAGTYLAQLAVLTPGNGATLFVPVTLNVSNAPPVTITPSSLVFTSPYLTAPQSFQQAVTVTSASAVQFNVGFVTDSQANWLGASPGSGSTPTQVTVVVNPVGLGPGAYTGKVQIAPVGGIPVTIPITLVVTTPPVLSWSVPAVTATFITGGPVPAPVTVNLASSSAALQFLIPDPQASWLSLSTSSGTTPTDITLTFDPTGLAPGVYQAVLSGYPVGTQSPVVTMPVSFSVQEAAPTISAILNAASLLPAALAPGEEVQIIGSGLGPVTQADATADPNGLFETSLVGASVYINGFSAPVLHASDGQITVLVPYEIAGQQSTTIVAEYLYAQSAPQTFAAADSNPGLFTVDGTQGVVFNADGSANSLMNGANPGDVIGILGTGEGQTSPGGVDGMVMQNGALSAPLLPVTVMINGEQAVLVSATSAPGQPAGVFLIQVQVPGDIAPGSVVPVSVTIGSATTQTGVTMVIAPPQ